MYLAYLVLKNTQMIIIYIRPELDVIPISTVLQKLVWNNVLASVFVYCHCPSQMQIYR